MDGGRRGLPKAVALPSGKLFIYHTFKRYSIAAAAVIQWLCVTAEGCGYDKYPANPTNKTAIKKAKSRPGVPISEYLTLAKTITASTERQVPVWVLQLLWDMIEIRKICVVRFPYSSHSSENEESTSPCKGPPSLEVIRALEAVLIELETRMEKASERSDAPFSQEHTFHRQFVSNDDYERLFSDEPTKAGQEWQERTKPINVHFKQVKDKELQILMLQCLFEDFQSIRQFASRCWRAYRRRETDLDAVSVVTNTAIQFLGGLMEDVEQSFPGGKVTYEQLTIVATQWSNLKMDDFDPIFKHFAEKQRMDNQLAWDVAEQICLPAYTILNDFRDECLATSTVKFTHYEEPLTRIETEPVGKFRESKKILHCLLVEAAVLCNCPVAIENDIPCTDMLTRGLMAILNKEKVPNWLPLACTMYLDLHQELGADLERGQLDFSLSCRRIQNTVESFLRLPQILPIIPSKTPKHDRGTILPPHLVRDRDDDAVAIEDHVLELTRLIQDILWFEADHLKFQRALILPRLGRILEMAPHHLLRMNPLLCGVLEFNFTIRMQKAGLRAMNDWGAAAAIAHLYSAIRHEMPNGEFERWPDMDWFIALHPELGTAPRNASVLLQRHERCTGFPSDWFEDLPSATSALQLLQMKPRSFYIFDKHYVRNEAVTYSLFKKHWEWTSSTFLTPERLFTELSLCLRMEFFGLRFNYLSFHMRCMRVLHRIHRNLDVDFVSRFGEGYIENKHQLPFVVGYLLTDLCMHGSVKMRRQQVHRSRRLEGDVSADAVRSSPVYEPAHCDNEVFDAPEVYLEFEDYSMRDPDCPVQVPKLLFRAARIIEKMAKEEGDWERKALESIKNPAVVNPAMENWKGDDVGASGAWTLLSRWMTIIREN